jgi:hypothetical protein
VCTLQVGPDTPGSPVGGLGAAAILSLSLTALAVAATLRLYLQREPDPFVRRFVLFGLAAKLLGTFAYRYVVSDVYGRADATGYIEVGRSLVPAIRSGSLPENALEPGTRFTELLAGVVFTIFGPSEIVGYLVFSLLAFLGLVLCFHAFRLAVPDGAHHRYLVLVLLLPTMLYWSSAIGKDAWVVFTLGVAGYGAARVLRRFRFGYPLVLVSLAAMAMVRPHMAALFAVSFLVAFLVRLGDRSVRHNAIGWVAGLAMIAIGVGFALTNFSEEMGRGESEEDAALTDRVRADVDEIFERTDRLTREGGGEFESRPVRSPVDLVHALITVPFRPFPFEGHNLQAQIAGVEGLLLLALVLAALPKFRTLPRRLLRSPYVTLAATYSLGFVVAFSNVGNFGILTRQRAQLLPMLLVLLAVPRIGELARPPASSRTRRQGPVLVYLPPESRAPDIGA